MPPTAPALPASSGSRSNDYDFLLVGHGVAGALLGWELRRRGHRVLVYDAPQPDSASNVAAGLMNPVAGKRFALSWRAAELLPTAAATYRRLEAELGQQFFFEKPIFKVFGSGQEQQDILGKSLILNNSWEGFVSRVDTTDPLLAGLQAPFGGAWLRGAAT
jgi:glycine/D-amino acid oxidase-like deaminating enzyme